jgi:NAD(P)H dehydrogenase (quinone)
MVKRVSVAIVYHSGFGHTDIAARAVARGAAREGDATLIKIDPIGTIGEQDWAALKSADAIIFGSPTYMGSVSGPFKMFADSTSKTWYEGSWKDKLAGGFTNSSSMNGDKVAALIQLAILAAQHGMIWVGQAEMPPIGPPLVPHQRDPDAINRLGSGLGLMTLADDVAPEGSISNGDLKTAELFGERMVRMAQRFAASDASEGV